MRLLHFESAMKLVLVDFSGRDIPPYAILSHRWSDGEVLFEDVRNNCYGEKPGHRKIKFCAAQAARDQLNYFWIDTCCIDKWNVDELSKAINSMYSWYRDAARCYVFLPDVSVSTTASLELQDTWETSFRGIEWFTRGWTLQELIAPGSVEFFSIEGHRLGDKMSLEKLICEVTGIPPQALQGYPLESFSIPERTSWANSRRTTEPEDKAYCLLGILGTQMPTSYGEGEESARQRLHDELESSTPSMIPYSRNLRFVGRESQLAELEGMLFKDDLTTIIAISGPGGIGKSQLALELAYRIRESDRNCLVFWIDASDMNGLRRAYLGIAQKLHIPNWNEEEADVQQLVNVHLSEKGVPRWLLIFDNADDTSMWTTGSSTSPAIGLAQHLPQSERGSIVFTTTSNYTVKIVAKENVIALQELAPDIAERMLNNHLIRPIRKSEEHEAKQLLKELLHLPLAIVLAAAYIKLTKVSLEQYRLQLVKFYGQDTRNPIALALLISLEQIRVYHLQAFKDLVSMACVDRKDIPVDLLVTPLLGQNSIRLLENYALITRRPAESAVEIHRVLHLRLRNWLQDQQLLKYWTEKALERLLEIFPSDEYGNRSKWRRLLPHVKYILSSDVLEQDHADATDLASRCAIALFSDGQWKEAEELFVRVVETMQRVRGEEHSDVLTAMANLASTYSNQGRWKEAEELFVRLMQTRKLVLGAEHPDTIASMTNLAAAYMDQGRWQEAEELFLQVIEASKQVLGEEHPGTLVSMGDLASTYMEQGRWKEAEDLFMQVTETNKRVLGDEHPNTITSMASIASIHMKQGRWKEAEELFVQAIATSKRVLGEEHPYTLASMTNLTSTYMQQAQWKKAEVLGVKVMETSKRVLGEAHPDTLISMAALASAYRDEGRWKEAEELEVQVMEGSVRVLGEEHPDTLTSIVNLASTYREQGSWKEAEELLVQVTKRMKQVLGEEHPDTVASIANLAATYSKQGRWKDAEELELQVIVTMKRVLGEEHPDTMTVMSNLASTYRDQMRWKEAEELFAQVMEASTRVLGKGHLDTLISMEKLAMTYKDQGRWKEADELETQVTEIMKRVLGDDQPNE